MAKNVAVDKTVENSILSLVSTTTTGSLLMLVSTLKLLEVSKLGVVTGGARVGWIVGSILVNPVGVGVTVIMFDTTFSLDLMEEEVSSAKNVVKNVKVVYNVLTSAPSGFKGEPDPTVGETTESRTGVDPSTTGTVSVATRVLVISKVV